MTAVAERRHPRSSASADGDDLAPRTEFLAILVDEGNRASHQHWAIRVETDLWLLRRTRSLTPRHGADPSAAGRRCARRTPAAARAANTVRPCCRSTASSCIHRVRICGSPRRSGPASIPSQVRYLRSAIPGRVAVPSPRSDRSAWSSLVTNDVGLPGDGTCQTIRRLERYRPCLVATESRTRPWSSHRD